MKLVNHNSEILHKATKPFDFWDNTAAELASNLQTIRREKRGYGLAAPQIGADSSVFAFLDEVAFNPEILEKSEILENITEGCLSYPELWITVKRPIAVKVRYQTVEGEFVERDLDGLEARVFLHEFDHLLGKTIIDDASNFKLKRAIEKAEKNGYAYKLKDLKNI